ncbi:MAG: hypothetical protein MJ237_02820 [bacterium]|nr:hypothetical protein [bacterium]
MVVSYPTQHRNYCIFDTDTEKKISRGENEIANVKVALENPSSEDDVVENLYILNRMLDNGVDKEKITNLYPVLSAYNNTKSPNIQTYLAGIYRKTKIPDAFGPLIKMLIRDSIEPIENAGFDPTEEIGGAILDYLV